MLKIPRSVLPPLLSTAMWLCRFASVLGLVTLLALQVCSSARLPDAKAGPGLLQKLPSIHGINAESLYKDNPADAIAAYKDCMKHGAACSLPCTSISNCAGCHPGINGNTTVCGFCMPGHYMSADRKSCVVCAESTFSAGGRAASCSLCPEGQTSAAGAGRCTGGKQAPWQQGRAGLRGDLYDQGAARCFHTFAVWGS
jgi:hypothetical protein